jgi:hypothetical protein
MMTTYLFVIANVKQLRSQVVLEFYCLFFRTSCGVGFLNSVIFNNFHKRGCVWHNFGGPSEFRRGGLVYTPQTPLGTPLVRALLVDLVDVGLPGFLREKMKYIWVLFLNPEDTKILNLEFIWNCNKRTGLS